MWKGASTTAPLIIDIYDNRYPANKWCQSIITLTLLLKASVQISIELNCLTLMGLFVRYISNLPSASDKKLCFTPWQLKLCCKSNDKSVCSKFQMLFLVDSDIHIAHHWDGNDINTITGYIVTLVVGYFYYW